MALEAKTSPIEPQQAFEILGNSYERNSDRGRLDISTLALAFGLESVSEIWYSQAESALPEKRESIIKAAQQMPKTVRFSSLLQSGIDEHVVILGK